MSQNSSCQFVFLFVFLLLIVPVHSQENEYFIKVRETIEINEEQVTLNWVNSGSYISVSVGQYSEILAPLETKIISGLEFTSVETFYDPTNNKNNAATLRITNLDEKNSGTNPNEHFLNVGKDAIDIDGKFVILEKVENNGDIIVSVDGIQELIKGKSLKIIKCLIIKNKETYYNPKTPSESAATLEIVIANLCNDVIDNDVIESATLQRETYEPTKIATDCNGCLDENNNCIGFGIRSSIDNSDFYCGFDTSWHLQKEDNDPCQNNYECKSNQCSNGYCINLQEQLRETQNILQKIWDWISRLFS